MIVTERMIVVALDFLRDKSPRSRFDWHPGLVCELLEKVLDDELWRIEIARSSPFDLSKTMIDEHGNTLLFDRYRGEYVNCGQQNLSNKAGRA